MTALPSSPDEPFTTAFSIDVLTVPPSQVSITVAGELDVLTSPRLAQSLTEVLTGDPAVLAGPLDVVVDLSRVTFLNSAGLTALVTGHRQAGERGHRLRVLAATRAVVHPLQITGLWDLLAGEQVPPERTGATGSLTTRRTD